MKKIKFWFRTVFGFNQTEINGFIILSIILVLLVVAPFFVSKILSNKSNSSSANDDKILKELIAKAEDYKQQQFEKKSISKPNYKSFKETKSEKPIHVIKSEGEQLNESKPNWIPNKYKREITPFDINLSDTTQFKQIKGIGSKLSARIIKYRNKLGGFYTTNQLKEVWGIDSNLINENAKYFLLNQPKLNIINLDTSGVKTLIKHPYIDYKKAISIVNYRKQHGNYKSVKDLEKLHLLKKEDIEKLSPYLSFE